MAHDCDLQFEHMSTHFDQSMAVYRKDCDTGSVRKSVAGRVCDIASAFTDNPDQEAATAYAIWYAAIAMERLMALELAGVIPATTEQTHLGR